MTSTAYDVKEEGPFRTQLDPLRTAEVIYAGGVMLERERDPDDDKPVTLQQIIWRLIQEAVECDRAIRMPNLSYPLRSGPEVFYTRSEIWAVELQWAADNITYTPRYVNAQPSAAAHQRYLEVMTWFRFITSKSKNKSTFVRMLIALARGMPPSRAADVFKSLYYRNGDAVWAAKYRAVNQIADRLRRACKKLDLVE